MDLEDVATAHLLALEKAPSIGFGRYIISATTPFVPDDLLELRVNAPRVVERRFPDYEAEYARRGWRMFPVIDRVYVNERARKDLGWIPRYDFRSVLDRLRAKADFRSPLARAVGSKGYHPHTFAGRPLSRVVTRSGLVSRKLAEAPDDATLVVFHSAVLGYVSPDRCQAFVNVQRTRFTKGRRRSEVVALAHPHGPELKWL